MEINLTTNKIDRILKVINECDINELVFMFENQCYDIDKMIDSDIENDENVEKTDTEINFKQEFAMNLFSYELFIVNYLKILLQFKYDLEQIEDKYKLIKISSESQNSKKFNSMTRYLILFLIIN